MSIRPAGSEPRVAIASVGLGRIQRGYERCFYDIFDSLRDVADIALFRSAGGAHPREKVPALLGPATAACRLLPLGVAAGAGTYTKYKNDCLAFGLTLLPRLVRNEFDVVHVVDYPLAIALIRLRKLFRYQAQVIFTDGGLMPPQWYPRVDHVHIPAQAHYLEALGCGVPEDYTTMIPAGFHARRFMANGSRAQLRSKHGISENTFVILSVAALNRTHKRVDHIIEEAGRVTGDILLWLDGRLEDPTLIEMARAKFGDRCRITHVPSAEVPELYHLADVFVHAALEEGFGLAVCEAAAASLPVLVHDSAHFQWLLGDRDYLLDMTASGQLTRKLQELADAGHHAPNGTRRLAGRMRGRFDWEVLAPEYLNMYRKVAARKTSHGRMH